MPGGIDFIEKYGDVSFNEKPFCDADNLVLCQVSYMPMEKVIGDSFNENRNFSEAWQKMFEFNGNEHIALGLVLTADISRLLEKIALCKRYSEMKITGCKGVVNTYPAVQFGVATYILPDGKNVICFRGTDDSLIGWKEDIDIYTKKGIPSHQIAVDYIEKAAKSLDGDLIIIGHSKGGNVALYGAMNVSEETRKRITAVYNNDGPGFCNYDYIESEAYKELLPKYHHFVPTNSFVGMFLAHDDDYEVVNSSKILGPNQHDLATWIVDDDTFEFAEKLNKMGRINDIALHNLVFEISDFASDCFDKVSDVIIYGSGQPGLLEISKNIGSSVKNIAKTFKVLDKSTKKGFVGLLKHGAVSICGAVREANRKVKIVKEEMSFA